MLTDPSIKAHLWACIVTCGICLAIPRAAMAGDCDCDSCRTSSSYGYCVTTSNCDCIVCRAAKHSYKPTCVLKALDALAGGVEKAFGLDKCGCNNPICDDGCDASRSHELMLPVPLHHGHPHHNHHSAPIHSGPIHSGPAHATPAPPQPIIKPYSGPTRDIQLSPTGPSRWEGSRQRVPADLPVVETLEDSGQHLGEPQPVAEVPPPVRMRDPQGSRIPEVDPSTDRESLFDTMTDPFQDDQTRARTYRSVRPSNYESPNLRPIRRRPLPSQSSSAPGQ